NMRLRQLFSTSLITAATVVSGGCESPQNFMQNTGRAAQSLAALGWFMLGVFTVTAIVVWLLVLWIATRRRGTLDWHAPIDAHEDRRWIGIGGIAIPLVVL